MEDRQGPLPPGHTRRQRRLLGKAHDGRLTPAEQVELADLRAVTDRAVIRRSFALALLKWRGQAISVEP